MANTFLAAQGARTCRRRWSRRTSSPSRARSSRRRRPRASRSLLPGRRGRGRVHRGDARGAPSSVDAIPAGHDGARHRARRASRSFREALRGREDHLLERADGALREGAVRRAARSAWREAMADVAAPSRSSAAATARPPFMRPASDVAREDEAHLDGRRRLARARRGEEAARHRGSPRTEAP